MENKSNYKYLLSDLSVLKGVGAKTSSLLKKKKINNIFDLLWKLPKSYTDRSLTSKIKDLRIGEEQTITIVPQKYSFPRVRNLPNKVLCKDETGEIDCIFFNSYEGYVRKILPLGKEITVSGKIGYFKNKYQLTNPKYLSEDSFLIKQKHNTYSLTEGVSEKMYNKMIASDADMIIASTDYNIEVPYAILENGPENNIISLSEKPSYKYNSNAGIYIFKRELINKIPKNEFFDITDLIILLIKENFKIINYSISGFWIDIGKFEDYEKAKELLKHQS